MKKALPAILFFLSFKAGFTPKNSPASTISFSNSGLLNNTPFADLHIEDTSGNIFNTSSLSGKTIYVDFWFTACPPCIKEIPYAQSLQTYFEADTNIVFLSICIENIERKPVWKQMIQTRKMGGVQLFYARNRPQKVNLLRAYNITFPTYLLVNKEMKVTGYDAPRPSEEGLVQWAIAQAEAGNIWSSSYIEATSQSKDYRDFLNEHLPDIIPCRPKE